MDTYIPLELLKEHQRKAKELNDKQFNSIQENMGKDNLEKLLNQIRNYDKSLINHNITSYEDRFSIMGLYFKYNHCISTKNFRVLYIREFPNSE